MRKSMLILPLIFLLSACASNDTQYYGQIDLSQKTITVPPGAKGLKGDIKKALNQEGWKMSVYRGPNVTKGSMGKDTHLETFDTFKTRYTLFVNDSAFDYCLNFSPMISYEIALIDNKSGAEIITMDGQGCENQVAEKFIAALKKK